MKYTLGFLAGLTLVSSAYLPLAYSQFVGGGAGGVVSPEGSYAYLQYGQSFDADFDYDYQYHVFLEAAHAGISDLESGTESFDLEQMMLSLNGSISTNFSEGFWGELGAGAGLARVELSGPDTTADDTDFVFMGQLFANVGVSITDYLDCYTGVKYYYVGETDYQEELALESTDDFIIQAGIRVAF